MKAKSWGGWLWGSWLATFALLISVIVISLASPDKQLQENIQSDVVEVVVYGTAIDRSTNTTILSLKDPGSKKGISMTVSLSDAQSIEAFEEGRIIRPFAHDLMKSVLDAMGVEFQKAVIDDIKDEIYLARIYLRAKDRDLSFDCRPSDAVALAIRFNKPIFALKKFLSASALPPENPPAMPAPDESKPETRRQNI